MTVNIKFNPWYYKISESQFTDQPTPRPVGPDQAFFQPGQKKAPKNEEDLIKICGTNPRYETVRCCTILSLDVFAGRRVVDVNEYARMNNAHWMKKKEHLRPEIEENWEMTFEEGLRVMNLYKICAEDINKTGIGDPEVTKRYIEDHLKDFDLRPTTNITFLTQRSLETRGAPRRYLYDMPRILRAIEGNPDQHRVIITLFNHTITVRKDRGGKWRVVDTMVLSHDKRASDRISQLQPGCKSLVESVEKAVPGVREYYKEDGYDPKWDGINCILFAAEKGSAEERAVKYTAEAVKSLRECLISFPRNITEIVEDYID